VCVCPCRRPTSPPPLFFFWLYFCLACRWTSLFDLLTPTSPCRIALLCRQESTLSSTRLPVRAIKAPPPKSQTQDSSFVNCGGRANSCKPDCTPPPLTRLAQAPPTTHPTMVFSFSSCNLVLRCRQVVCLTVLLGLLAASTHAQLFYPSNGDIQTLQASQLWYNGYWKHVRHDIDEVQQKKGKMSVGSAITVFLWSLWTSCLLECSPKPMRWIELID
jgi:hypothetical protein